jgi:hypothetical protein
MLQRERPSQVEHFPARHPAVRKTSSTDDSSSDALLTESANEMDIRVSSEREHFDSFHLSYVTFGSRS